MKRSNLFTLSAYLIIAIASSPSLAYADNCTIPENKPLILEAKDIDVLVKNRSWLKTLVKKYGKSHINYADALASHALICWRAGLYQESAA